MVVPPHRHEGIQPGVVDDGEGGDGADEIPAVRGQLRHVAAPPAPGDVAPVLLFFFLVRGIHALPDKEAHHVEHVNHAVVASALLLERRRQHLGVRKNLPRV
jgi:hypothetical protein